MLPILNLQQEDLCVIAERKQLTLSRNAHDAASIPQKKSASAGYETLKTS